MKRISVQVDRFWKGPVQRYTDVKTLSARRKGHLFEMGKSHLVYFHWGRR